jgi:hypothetical protein
VRTDQAFTQVSATWAGIDAYDLAFVVAAIAFNLLIAGVLVAQKKGRPRLVRTLGVLTLSLAIPFAIVFVRYMIVGRGLRIAIYFGFVFLYILVELLLDFILKIEFRHKWISHVPYIVLEYAALFGLIGISFAIGPTWGYLVSISFWMLLGSLIYLYWGRRRREDAVAAKEAESRPLYGPTERGERMERRP